MHSLSTSGKPEARPGPRVPIVAPLAVLGLSALILGLVLLAGCSGDKKPGPGEDVPGTDVHEVVDALPDPGLEADENDLGPDASCAKPLVVIQSPVADDLLKGSPRVTIQASHVCGIASVRVRLDFPAGVKSEKGGDLGLIEICNTPNPDSGKTLFQDCKLPKVFKAGTVDKAGNDISDEGLPDGPVKVRVSATAECGECTATAGATVSIVLDNHGPAITLVAPAADDPECVKDDLYIEFWAADAVSGMAASGALDVQVDGVSIATPDTAAATSTKHFAIHHHLTGVTDGAVTVTVKAKDTLANSSEIKVDVCVERVPTFRIVQKAGPRGADNQFLNTETRWIDYGTFEIDGDEVPVVLLATLSGVYGSKLTPQGQPTLFVQLTNASAEFVRAVPSRMGYPFAMVVVELKGSSDWQLVVYEDPFSDDGHPAPPADGDLEVVGDGSATADVVAPPEYDWARLVEVRPIKGSVTAAWMGDLIDDGDGLDVVVGTVEPTTGVQIFRGASPDGEVWFEPKAIEVPAVELTESIVVADMDGDGLKDITIGRAGGGGYQGFKQTLQYEPGKFSWAQNHVPTCPDPSFKVADVPSLDVAPLIDEEESVPEIVTVSSELDKVTVLRRKASAYVCAPTTFVSNAPPAPTLLVGSQPSKVLIVDLNHDDLQDLVVVNGGSGNVTVLPSFANGDNFQVAVSKAIYYNVGPDPFRVWSFDLDQDACPDLVVAHEGTSAYSWLRNPACDGNLLAAVDSPMPVDPNDVDQRLNPLKFGVADVDLVADQFDDVVLLTDRIDVDEPAASGGTTKVKHFPLWFYQSRGAAGDGVESSAKEAGLLPSDFATVVTDMAVGNVAKSSHPDVLITFLTPGATGPAPDPENPQPPGPVVSRVAVAAMAWTKTGTVSAFESLFDMTGTGETGAPTVPFYADPVAVALGHVSLLTPENMVDFVTVHAEKGEVGSLEYRPPMLVSYQVNTSTTGAPLIQRDLKVGAGDGVGRGPVDAVLGLFSALSHGSGNNDVLVGNSENKDVSLFQGTNQGKFADALPAFGLGAEPIAITGVYWNDDCFLDIAILTGDNLAIAYWNEDSKVFEPASFFYGEDPLTSLATGQEVIRGAVDFLVADTNHDCRDDLVVLNKNRSQILVFTSTGRQAPGEALPTSPVTFPTGSGPIQLAKGRFNADSCDDLAVLNGRGESFTVLIGSDCTVCTPACP